MQFRSRRNVVLKANNLIQKSFSNEKSFNYEIGNLKFLRNKSIRVPKIISFEYPTLYLEFIDGENFCDLLDNINDIQIESLYDWLKHYHKATNSLRGDINLRNFLITKDNITYGVDFEEKILRGDFEKDYGKIIAYIATYNPKFNDKKVSVALKFCEKLQADNADFEKIEKYYFEEIELMKLRRKTDTDFLQNAKTFYNKIVINIIK